LNDQKKTYDKDNIVKNVEDDLNTFVAQQQTMRPAGPPVGAADTAAILGQRQATHGAFFEDARISQALKHVIRESVNWNNLGPEAREALDNTMTKVARILAGDPRFRGHWEDIVGYAILVLRTIP